jgi:hypothetical protein
MAIDKESSGFPEIDVHHKTTKVNLSIVGGVMLFFVIVFAALFYFARNADNPSVNRPSSSSSENASNPARR